MFGLLFGNQLFGPGLVAYGGLAAVLPPGQPVGLTVVRILMILGAA